MHPVLFEIPALPAWMAALLVALLGAVFFWLGRKDVEDRGSWWLAGICGIGAAAILAYFKSDRLPVLPIRLFGLLVVAGFLVGTQVVAWRNRRRNLLGGEETFDLAFYILLAGLAGSRMLHVMQHSDEFAGHPQRILYLWDGGLVWYGGAFTSTLYAWYWLAKRGKPLWDVSDSLALGLPLAHAIGRLGCFAAGCDYGKKIDFPEGGTPPWYAIHYPLLRDNPYSLVPPAFIYDPETDRDVYVHPAQLYLVFANLVMFAILLWMDRRGAKGRFPGQLAAMYFILYAIGRGVVENWRGDADRGTYDLGFMMASFSQVVSVLVLVAGILMYRALKRRPPEIPAAA